VTFRVFQAESVKKRHASYFFGGGLGKAVVGDAEWFGEKASKGKSVIAQVVDTHAHALPARNEVALIARRFCHGSLAAPGRCVNPRMRRRFGPEPIS
jgi:hypothetical protein